MQSTPPTGRAERFGGIVKSRRQELRLSKVQVRDLGGPSTPTLLKIEDGKIKDAELSVKTFDRLDVALRWTRGSAERAFHGGIPEPQPHPGTPNPPSGAALAAAPDTVPLAPAELTRLLTIAGELNELARRAPAGDGSLPEVAGELNRLASTLAGRYATAVLERNGGPGTNLNPLLANALGQRLHRRADASDPAAHEEEIYRRWLAGQPIELDAATRFRFMERWEAARATADAPRASDDEQ